MIRKFEPPFLGLNPKSMMYGDELLDLAIYADQLAEEYDIGVTFTAPFVDLANIISKTSNLFVNAQYMDGIYPGRGMGYVLPASLKNIGVDGVILNHAEKLMTVTDLVKAVKIAKELGLHTSICCDSVEEASLLAHLHPTTMICEPTSLIGTGTTSSPEYRLLTRKAVHDVDPNILISQGASIKNGNDVYNAIKDGSDSGGGSSGIFMVDNPKAVILDMAKAVKQAKADFYLNGKRKD